MYNKTTSDPNTIRKIIDKCESCCLGMADTGGTPYVLPFNFAYDGQFIYLHAGPGGKKMDILKKNNKVALAFSTDHELFHRHENVACSYGMKFRSVVANGTLEIVTDFDKKIEVLNKIMLKYTGREFTYNAPAINNVSVFIVHVESISAKELGY